MSLLSRVFRSKPQKSVDALQDKLNRRLVAVQDGLQIYTAAGDRFAAMDVPEGSGEWKAFSLAQRKHQYFTSALIDDLSAVEEEIRLLQRTLDVGGKPSVDFASRLMNAESSPRPRSTRNASRR